jgi:hypothetical protein
MPHLVCMQCTRLMCWRQLLHSFVCAIWKAFSTQQHRSHVAQSLLSHTAPLIGDLYVNSVGRGWALSREQMTRLRTARTASDRRVGMPSQAQVRGTQRCFLWQNTSCMWLDASWPSLLDNSTVTVTDGVLMTGKPLMSEQVCMLLVAHLQFWIGLSLCTARQPYRTTDGARSCTEEARPVC